MPANLQQRWWSLSEQDMAWMPARLFGLLLALLAAAAPAAGAQPDWARDQILYHVFVDRFYDTNKSLANQPNAQYVDNWMGGDFQGMIDKMAYLKSVGVTCLLLGPPYKSGGWLGYGPDDFYQMEQTHFGGNTKFAQLVAAANANGIKVMIDFVPNHISTWASQGHNNAAMWADSRISNWSFYNFSYTTWGNTPWNHTDTPTRSYMAAVISYWAANGVAGMRMDHAKFEDEVFQNKAGWGDPSQIPHQYWIATNDIVKAAHPDFFMLGEVWDNEYTIGGYVWNGEELDGNFNFGLRDRVRDWIIYNTKNAQTFREYIDWANPSYVAGKDWMALFLDNHDVTRFLSDAGGDQWKLRMAAIFQLTWDNIPVIYSGDEIGADMGTRNFFDWRLNADTNATLTLYKTLCAARQNRISLRRGGTHWLLSDAANDVLAYCRWYGNEKTVVILNNKPFTQTVWVDLNSVSIPSGTLMEDVISRETAVVNGSNWVSFDVAGHYGVVLYAGGVPAGQGRIAGRVTRKTDSAAIQGAAITFGVHSTVTDTTGNFRIDGVTTGTDTLRVVATGYQYAESRVTVLSGDTVTCNFVLWSDTTPPADLVGVSASPDSGAAYVSWSASPAADSSYYAIYVDTQPLVNVRAASVRLAETVSASVLGRTVTGLSNGQIYYFAVTAVDRSGNEDTVPSTTASCTPSEAAAIQYAGVFMPGTWNWANPDTANQFRRNAMPAGYARFTVQTSVDSAFKLTRGSWSDASNWSAGYWITGYDRTWSIPRNDQGSNADALIKGAPLAYVSVVSESGPTDAAETFGFLTTSAPPVSIATVTGGTNQVSTGHLSDTITVTLSGTKSAEERVWIVFTVETGAHPAWSNRSRVTATGSGTTWTCTLPAQSSACTVTWYPITTTLTTLPAAAADLPFLTLSADDNDGAYHRYRVELVSCSIVIIAPAANHDTTATAITVSGTTVNSRIGDTVRLIVNGTYQSQAILAADSGSWSCTAVISGIGSRLEAVVSTALGTCTAQQWIHYYDTPAVAITAPLDSSASPVAAVTVTGTTVNTNIGDQVKIYVNGIFQSSYSISDSHSSWNATVNLTDSVSAIVARLEGHFGRIAWDTVTVTYNTSLPYIAFTSPTSGSDTSVADMPVRGTTANSYAGDLVRLYVNGTLQQELTLGSDSGSWATTVALSGLGDSVLAHLQSASRNVYDTITVNYRLESSYADIFWPGAWNWSPSDTSNRLASDFMPESFCRLTRVAPLDSAFKVTRGAWDDASNWSAGYWITGYDQIWSIPRNDQGSNADALIKGAPATFTTLVTRTDLAGTPGKFGFLATSAAPVRILAASGGTAARKTYQASSLITLTLSSAKCPEEKVWVLYTIDTGAYPRWSNRQRVLANGSGTSYSCSIPAQSIGCTVYWHAITTTANSLPSPASDIDYLTLCRKDQAGDDWWYAVDDTAICRISGRVITHARGETQGVLVYFREDPSGITRDSAFTDSMGAYTLDVPGGSRGRVIAIGLAHLSRAGDLFTVADDTTIALTVTRAGDIDGDDRINVVDGARIRASMSRGFDSNADVNGDGIVDLRDLDYVREAFGRQGDLRGLP